MKASTFKSSLLIFSILLFNSCISLRDETWLQADLTGTQRISLGVSQTIEAFGKLDKTGEAGFSEAELVKTIKESGMTVLRSNTQATDKMKYYTAEVHFKNMEQYSKVGSKTGDTFYGTVRIKNLGNNKYQMIRDLNLSEEQKEELDPQMDSMFEEYKWVYIVHFPAKVHSTNGIIAADGKTVEWAIPFSRVFSAPMQLQATFSTK